MLPFLERDSGVAELPLDACVEVEGMFEVK